ncbi:cytosolic factor, phosphatidylinositol/phosphatidylcholine transfer protein [Phlyctochytrium bullatum]|nr:cytosolic factor, phosphatidylinositol/phosphatidylcholine transfer protein [Phlyctochytrium bullatum]
MGSLANSMENLSGRLGHLTAEQEEILAKFKEELTAEGFYDPAKHDDHLLLRFLRARKFQIPLSKKMWIECETWRKEYGTDDLRDNFEFPEYPIVKKFYPRFYHKVDKIGRPLYVERFGVLDINQLFSVTTDERMLKNHVYEYEKLVHYRLPACSKKYGRHLEQSCVIMDLKGVAISMFPSVFGLVKMVSSIAQNYYPEMLGKMFIINSPMLFTGVWTLVKPLLDEVTVNKIYILGSGYKDKLLEFIDADCLPESLGGTCNCPGGCDLSDIGPWNDGSVAGYPKKEYERFERKNPSVVTLKRDIGLPQAVTTSSRPTLPPVAKLHSPGTVAIAYALIFIYVVAGIIVGWRHHDLPHPQASLFDPVTKRPQFSENAALEHVAELADRIGLRIAGTKGDDQAKQYILSKLNEYKATAAQNPFIKEFDIIVEQSSGSHRFDFMGEVVMKTYKNISNIIVKISCGESCDQNSILVNSHYDSQISTPGACDDAAPVSVMMEIARVMAQRNVPMRNSLVLLWNGAEESLQDASHAFVTTSPLAKNVRGFINLEAMGNHGGEILFQANTRGMVDAYKAVPHPHGSVVSNDIFATGLILSDTDFRQFVDYGNIVGIVGLLQHMGENTLALVDHLMGNVTIEKFEKGRNYIYYDVLGSINAPGGTHFPIHLLCYTVTYPAIAATALRYTFMALNLFVPLTGRMGTDTPADAIVGGLRVFIQYVRNATSGDRTVHISHADPSNIQPVLETVSKVLNSSSRAHHVDEKNKAWSTIYPFSKFVDSHVFDVTHLHELDNRRDVPAPKLIAEDVKWDPATQIRTLTVRCYHPDHVRVVLNFEADVVDWSLGAPPRRGHLHHFVRHAGGYGEVDWTFTLSVRAASADEKLVIHLSGTEPDTFNLSPPVREKTGRKSRISAYPYQWRETTFESGKVLSLVQEALPKWTSAMLLGVVVNDQAL